MEVVALRRSEAYARRVYIKRPPAATVNRQPRDFTRSGHLLMHAQPNFEGDRSARIRINFYNAALAALDDRAQGLLAKTRGGELPDEYDLRRLVLDAADVVRLADELAGSPGGPIETASGA